MSFSALLEYIDAIVADKLPFVDEVVHLFLEQMKQFGFETGFNAQQMDEIIQKFFTRAVTGENNKIENSIIRKFLLCLPPKDNVSTETVDFLIAWCLTYSNQKNAVKLIKPVLKWIIALVLCDIYDRNNFKHTTYILLNLLQIPGLHDDVSYLLYLILDRDLITAYTIKCLLSVKPSKSILAVLSLCRRLKPHLLKDYPIINNETKHFPQLGKDLLRNISLFLCSKPGHNANKNRFENWSFELISFQNKRNREVKYINGQSLVETLLLAKLNEIFYDGSSCEALITNDYGFIYIALGSAKLQETICKYINYILVENAEKFNEEEISDLKLFFKKIFCLQNFLQQSLPVVDNFLLKIFKFWNGNYYRDEVFDLISCVSINTDETFLPNILNPMYELMRRNDFEICCKILKCLTMLIFNNVKYHLNTPILHIAQKKPNQQDILSIEKCFKHFCLLFINMNKENCLILHEIVGQHIFLSMINKPVDPIQIDYLLPTGIFHNILLSSDFVLVNRVCRLIIRKYESSIKDMPLSTELVTQMSDIMDIFFKHFFKSSLFTESIARFPFLEEEIFKYIQFAKSSFKLKNSLTFKELYHINEDGEYNAEKCGKDEIKKRLTIHCSALTYLLMILHSTN